MQVYQPSANNDGQGNGQADGGNVQLRSSNNRIKLDQKLVALATSGSVSPNRYEASSGHNYPQGQNHYQLKSQSVNMPKNLRLKRFNQQNMIYNNMMRAKAGGVADDQLASKSLQGRYKFDEDARKSLKSFEFNNSVFVMNET